MFQSVMPNPTTPPRPKDDEVGDAEVMSIPKTPPRPKDDDVGDAEVDIQQLQRQDPELVRIISYLEDGLRMTNWPAGLCWRGIISRWLMVSFSTSALKRLTVGD